MAAGAEGARAQATVFYSWQSDSPGKTNRNFIEDALERAVKAVRGDGSLAVEPRIDQATLGVPGAPDIATTIFAKISAAGAFVADVSIINPGGGRPCPNPNVLVELGYALAALGKEKIVPVFNLASGRVEDLPFDLRGKRILSYKVDDGTADKPEQRKRLQALLTDAIRSIFEHARPPAAPREPTPAEAAVKAIESAAANQAALCTQFMRSLSDRVAGLIPPPPEGAATQVTQQLISAIDRTLPLVTEFTSVAAVAAAHNSREAVEGLFRGFEHLFVQYNAPVEFYGLRHRGQFELAKFVGHELFVTLVAALLANRRWEQIAHLCEEVVTVPNARGTGPGTVTFMFAAQHPELLHRGTRDNGDEYYRHTDLLAARHESGPLADVIGWQDFRAADLLLLFRSILAYTAQERAQVLFPETWYSWSALRDYTTPAFLLEARLARRAGELLGPLGLESVAQFRDRLAQHLSGIRSMFGPYLRFVPFREVDPAAIGTL